VALRTPEDIVDAVNRHDNVTEALRSRMEADYALYRLEDYTGGSKNDPDNTKLDGFRKYTSNDPRTFAQKIISLLTTSQVLIKVPQDDSVSEERNTNNDKERFLIGMIRAANEYLRRRMLPTIHNQLAFFTSIRGYYAGRCLLVKREEGDTYVDITPWDPLHTYWSMGGDGLLWACYRMTKTKAEIEDQYDTEINDEKADTDTYLVFDFFDDEVNMVVMEDRILKKATPHGLSGRVPVFIGAVGPAPPIQSDERNDMEADYGESIYSSDRSVYEEFNFAMSVRSELMSRSLKRPYVITSRDGRKTLSENPYEAGTEIALAEGDRIDLLNVVETTRDADMHLTLTSCTSRYLSRWHKEPLRWLWPIR
jgi:hypothetical protein